MSDLPTELWLRIATLFISDNELVRLVGVNLTFYNLALDALYAKVRVDAVDAKMEKFLQRLRYPIPASRVRKLVLRPPMTASHYYLTPAESTSPSSWFSWDKITGHGTTTAAATTRKRGFTIEDVVDSLALAFPGFVNLTHFEVEAWDMSSEYDLQSFFRCAWDAFGRSVKTVSVAGRPETFRQFVESGPLLASCTTLSLQFTHELDPTANAAVVGIMAHSVAPFINSLAPHLEALRIWSWSALDLSVLFLGLGHFPRLHTFHLRAPFNKAFLNSTGLTNFLETNSSSLNAVDLRLNPVGSAMDPSSERRLGEWFASHQAHPAVLQDLTTLQIYPTTLRSGFDSLVAYVERSAGTLTSLTVKDRYLELDEVEALIAPISHRSPDEGLRSLRLNVRVWSTELFDLLASRLPGLRSLSLYVGSSQAAMELFFTGMQNRSFESWKLYDIGVWQGGSEVSSNTMGLLASCIPSVQSFWNNGHMLGDSKLYYG